MSKNSENITITPVIRGWNEMNLTIDLNFNDPLKISNEHQDWI